MSNLKELIAFPSSSPSECVRNCVLVHEAHTPILSFAIYAAKFPVEKQDILCIRAFSCGAFYKGNYKISEGETIKQTVEAVIRMLVPEFSKHALKESKEGKLDA